MSDIQPLITLLEVMLNLSSPKINVKPGGYSDEIFLDLTEEQKQQYECSICYQILKDPRQCSNQHKYCYSCIFVWSTSGANSNHGQCPVCRTDGLYIRNRDIEERINNLKVKCHLKSCRWKGPLKLLGKHTHTTYTRTGLPYRSKHDEHYRSNSSGETEELPELDTRTTNPPESGARLSLRQPTSANRLTRRISEPITSRENTSTNVSLLQSPNTSSLTTPRTPRPPVTPRPTGQTLRRVPTLPSIVSQSVRASVGTTPESSIPVSSRRSEPRPPVTTRSTQSSSHTAQEPTQSYTSVRDRLRDSRTRLDALMTSFTNELERGRRGISEFQEERERRRQEQLNEVRDLGRRLNFVAQELRHLLDTRRQLRDELEEMAD